MMELSTQLQGILDTLPLKPGCYLMKDDAGKIIYVGKAVNLRSRVRSYFHAATDHSFKTSRMVEHIRDIEWIVVGSELEALILEMNLIKRHRPKYNVRLKDDKRYPYIKVHWADPFPKVTVTRNMVTDGGRYFGPYTSAWAVHQTLDLLRKIFPYLTCDRVITGMDTRACLWYDLKLCVAPCIGAAGQDEYRHMIDDLCRFLQGETDSVVERLQGEMAAAAESLRYEKAAALRDQLQAIGRVVEKQKIISGGKVDSDVLAIARNDGDACVQIFFIRSGKLIGREYFILEGARETEETEILRQFLTQFYEEAAYVPAELLLPVEVEEARIVEEWLSARRGGEKVKIRIPRRGTERDLVRMAAENAADTLRALRAQWEADRSKHVQTLKGLQQALALPSPPTRIECYDISNIQGTAVVASMVVFEQGVPRKGHYRRFKMRTVEGEADDFASMREVLRRRFTRWREYNSEEAPVGRKKDPSFALLPDLLLVDGGKGQLAEAVRVLQEAGLEGRVPVASLAKREEEVFLPGKGDAIRLPRDAKELFLLQRVRDEAHRFAVNYHREVRNRKGLASQLESIPGIGPIRRKNLLKTFGSIEGIRAAPLEELLKVKGLTEEVAKRLQSGL